jgi:fructosamine-3-kinase
MNRTEHIAAGLARALGRDPGRVALDPAGGGCINSAALTEVCGTTYFVKWNDRPLPDQFAAEAAGLEALATADSPLVIPRPVSWSDEGPGLSHLVLEYLPPGRRVAGFEGDLGRGLAALHRNTSGRGFGFPIDGYCGATPQPNGWMGRWVDFYAERRILHQARLARERGMGRGDVGLFERLCTRFDALLGDDEPPALIHGDLWSGNLHVAPDGRPSLIDPAAYYGHREAELGMMVLFGGFGRRVFDAYDQAYPLRPGWRERLDLYSLYHVLNHYNLFGGGYGPQAVGLARRFV